MALFPEEGVAILDVGAGTHPFRARDVDILTTVDFDPATGADCLLDVATTWPFGEESFDLIYLSHVLEHFYAHDRDVVIRSIYRSLKPEGLVFIRVPHRSSMQATGWEHHSQYGLHGATSLSHGKSPALPFFRAVSAGVSMSTNFYAPRTVGRAVLERLLNARWRLTENVLCFLVGGIPEVQFLLQRLPQYEESRLRSSITALTRRESRNAKGQ
jgi:predicted SAM-dependent methyltransferase